MGLFPLAAAAIPVPTTSIALLLATSMKARPRDITCSARATGGVVVDFSAAPGPVEGAQQLVRGELNGAKGGVSYDLDRVAFS